MARAAGRGSSCSQTRITLQPASSRRRSVSLSLRWVVSILTCHHALLAVGDEPCRGQPCQKQYAQSPETYLFTSKDGEPLHPDRVTKLFDKRQAAIRAEQVKRHAEAGGQGEAPQLPRLRLHDVRHTYATMGANAGVHPKVMAERLGHDVMTYMQTYVHTYSGMQESVAELIAAGVDAG